MALLVTAAPSRGLFLMKCRPPEHHGGVGWVGGEVSASAAAASDGDSGGGFRWSLAGETFNSDLGCFSVRFDRTVLSGRPSHPHFLIHFIDF